MGILIKGYASIYNFKDYQNDVIKPGAFVEEISLLMNKEKQILLLAHHNHSVPLGIIKTITEDNKGLYIEAIIDENNYNQEIYHQITNGLLNNLSVGIIPLDTYNEKSYRIIKKAQLIEISVVTIGANYKSIINKIETI